MTTETVIAESNCILETASVVFIAEIWFVIGNQTKEVP